jgi:dihydroorotate dehydrogenase
MVSRYEGLEGVAGIEIGLPPGVDAQYANELIEASTGELPLIVRLPVDRADFYLQSLAGAPISAISLGPPRGVLLDENGGVVSGRLFGPAIFPSMLASVKDVVHSGIPTFAAGGIYSRKQVEMLLKFGAAGVQLDSVLWSTGWGYDQG